MLRIEEKAHVTEFNNIQKDSRLTARVFLYREVFSLFLSDVIKTIILMTGL